MLIFSLVLSADLGCGAIIRPQPAADESLIIGYRTRCRSSLVLVAGDETFTSTITAAGPQKLVLKAQSELQDPPLYDSGKAYFCRDLTSHVLSFESKPGRSYRLHLDPKKRGQNSVSVWEAVDQRAIKTNRIDSDSKQTSLERVCGFFPSCDQYHLD